MSKAEEIHYKAVIAADKQKPPKDYVISAHADHFNGFVDGYVEGYHQAEKDLELTNEDVYDIWRIYNEVCTEGKIFGFDETSQEVLKRFKDFRERKKK